MEEIRRKRQMRRQFFISLILVSCINISAHGIGMGAANRLPPAPRLNVENHQPKLLKMVNAVYPASDLEAGTYGEEVIQMTVNELGYVTDTAIISGVMGGLGEAAVAAAKQWVFAPAVMDGKAIQANATAVFVFGLYGTPRALDLRSTGTRFYVHTGPESERLIMDQGGMLTGPGGSILSPADIRAVQERFKFSPRFDISTRDMIPLAVIDQTLQSLKDTGVSLFRLESPAYRYNPKFPFIPSSEPRLFYSVLLNGESDLIQLVGVDRTIEPTKIDLDASRIRELLPKAKGSSKILFFTMFVDGTGRVLRVENFDEDTKDAVTMLKDARVLAPGRRGIENVPTAVLLAIPTN